MPFSADARTHAQDLLDFIDASPSPWHAVATCARRLEAGLAARGFAPGGVRKPLLAASPAQAATFVALLDAAGL